MVGLEVKLLHWQLQGEQKKTMKILSASLVSSKFQTGYIQNMMQECCPPQYPVYIILPPD
jgi:hypothetical protein